MTIDIPSRVLQIVEEHPYPLLFATISGAHLYGFASSDSDWDVRGVHILPLREVVGLDRGESTIEEMRREEPEIDLVTHDVEKFFRLLLKKNGYVLEQLYSPLVVKTSPEHEELKTIARGCITRHHAHHYLGFADNQWRLFEKESPRRVKPLLYVFRVLLTGIHLMRSGAIEANLLRLNEDARLPYLDDLVARKLKSERQTIEDDDLTLYRSEYERLMDELRRAQESSELPEAPASRSELHELLVRLRLASHA